ncbi:hypothetical protein AB0G05_45095 [Nonomuraea wenchangensis]
MWTDWQRGIIAQNFGIGAGGPFERAEAWGPRHPDRDLRDWTQEGRESRGQFPEPTHTERTQRFGAARRAREEAFMNALTERGEAATRLAQGGRRTASSLTWGRRSSPVP